jgi:mono/diheme cytochrome c family protein
MTHLNLITSATATLLVLALAATSATAQDGHDDHAPETTAHAQAGNDDHVPPVDLEAGRMIYEMSCTFCHGRKGRGDGGAAIFLGPYSHPRPNDLTAATFKFRSTRSGEPPLLSDLMRTIRAGIPGFMPAYHNLGEDGIRQVAAYIATAFIPVTLPENTTLVFADNPGPGARTADSVRRGRQLYEQLGCAACHGADGRKTTPQLHDRRGLMVMPMDLTRPDMFGNGHSPEDIYRTLMTGLDGTPMPAYAEVFSGKKHELWDLVHFLMSLQRQ